MGKKFQPFARVKKQVNVLRCHGIIGKHDTCHGFIRVEGVGSNHQEMNQAIADTLDAVGPAVCEIMLDENVSFAPKLGAKQWPDGRITSPALEDLSPFLSREELKENMLISLIEDQ